MAWCKMDFKFLGLTSKSDLVLHIGHGISESILIGWVDIRLLELKDHLAFRPFLTSETTLLAYYSCASLRLSGWREWQPLGIKTA